MNGRATNARSSHRDSANKVTQGNCSSGEAAQPRPQTRSAQRLDPARRAHRGAARQARGSQVPRG
eukprot:6461799-Pyramimonas_sp.AAC.1